MIKAQLLSESLDKESFIQRFSLIPENEKVRSSSNQLPSSYWIHLLNLFSYIKKELIIVTENNIDIGRICINETKHGLDLALFGMLEYPKARQDVLHILLEKSEAWSKKNNKKQIIGPIDINVWFGNRFTYPENIKQYSFEPNNPPFYPIDCLAAGYELDQDYISCFYDIMDEGIERTKTGYTKAIEQGYKFRNLDLSKAQEIQKLYDLNIMSFSKNYLYEVISKEEYEQTHIRFLNKDNLKNSFFIIDKNNKEVGYIYCLTEGEYFVIKSLLIMPTLQGAQLSSALVHKALIHAQEKNFKKAAGAMVRKGNVSEYFFKNLGTAKTTHHYTLLKKVLN